MTTSLPCIYQYCVSCQIIDHADVLKYFF